MERWLVLSQTLFYFIYLFANHPFLGTVRSTLFKYSASKTSDLASGMPYSLGVIQGGYTDDGIERRDPVVVQGLQCSTGHRDELYRACRLGYPESLARGVEY